MSKVKKQQKNEHGANYDSVFNTHVRIRKVQLEYLKETKTGYSIAGYLDMIINFWREYEANFKVDKTNTKSKTKKD